MTTDTTDETADVLALAGKIGEHLLAQAKEELAYATTPEPGTGTEADNFGIDTPGTLLMNYDGSIDLVALARFVRQAGSIAKDTETR